MSAGRVHAHDDGRDVRNEECVERGSGHHRDKGHPNLARPARRRPPVTDADHVRHAPVEGVRVLGPFCPVTTLQIAIIMTCVFPLTITVGRAKNFSLDSVIRNSLGY